MFRPTLKRGLSGKAFALAVLVLACAMLAPVGALGKAGGTDRPVKGTASGTVTGVLGSPLDITIDLAGVATHIGKYRIHVDAVGVISGGEVVVDGTFTVVAANGDQLTGTAATTTPLSQLGEVHTTTAFLTITGGTGRFSDASGTLTSQNLETPICFAEPSCPGLIIDGLEGKLTGQISY
jgi:hypothetical protein